MLTLAHVCLVPHQATYIPRRNAIAVAFRDNTILVWDSVTYNVRARLELPEQHSTSNIACFAATSDEQYLVAGTRTGNLLVWELVSEVRRRVGPCRRLPPALVARKPQR